MNVLHTISGMDIKSGGPSLSTYVLVQGLRQAGVSAEIAAYATSATGEGHIAADDFIHYLPPPKSPRYGYSKEFSKLFTSKQDIDVYHAHGLWQYPSHGTAVWARKSGKPCVISPRGMLYPAALNKTAIFKRIAMALYQRCDLQQASCIHATCAQEYQYIRACGIRRPPVAIIPNAIDISGLNAKKAEDYGKKKVGFVGRFAPIKNIEALLRAWAQSGGKCADWELILVGDGAADYRKSLEELTYNKLGMQNVRFPGFLSGQPKEDLLLTLDCLVLPSKSENFGMVVPEALARGIPVIASKGTPWQELEGSPCVVSGKQSVVSGGQEQKNKSQLTTYNSQPTASGRCGWWIDVGVEPLTVALKEAMSQTDAERYAMGQSGRKLVEQKYSCGTVASQMKLVYEWLLYGGEVPDCVRLD